jgi:hypothetical protein
MTGTEDSIWSWCVSDFAPLTLATREQICQHMHQFP